MSSSSGKDPEPQSKAQNRYLIDSALPFQVYIEPKIPDARADVYRKKFNDLIGPKIGSLKVLDSYIIDSSLEESKLIEASRTLANESAEDFYVAFPENISGFDYVIEIGLLPGVTDNVGTTAQKTLEDFLKRKFPEGEKVYSSKLLFLGAEPASSLSEAELAEIANFLHNPLIERASVKSLEDFKSGSEVFVPRVKLGASVDVEVSEVDLELSDDGLRELGSLGIPNFDGSRRGPLALELDYMKTIQAHFQKLGRKPTDIELESIAQTWSEHCKHTIFADPIDEVEDGLYKAYIKKATWDIRQKKGDKDFCVSVFKDNSGGIVFDEEFLVTHKVETHNSPSALDPFGGSITGIVGVNRDAMGFGMGAKPIANTYGFCLGNPDDKRALYRRKNSLTGELEDKMLSPKRIMEGVIEGVKEGGNCSGIPTVHGFLNFHDDFRGKPLVFVGTIGLIPRYSKIDTKRVDLCAFNDENKSSNLAKKVKVPMHQKQAKPGDLIVMVGGRVGLDGIHGATFSSVVLDSSSPVTAVQIGDPITQKKMSDAIVKEARDKGLYNSITDNGAGGISCSVAEMARECGGCEVDLEKIPLKYPGLAPWQIWISESQERMTLSVPGSRWEELKELFDSRDVEATVIGCFTDSGKCVVKYDEKIIMDLELDFLHEGLPKRQLETSDYDFNQKSWGSSLGSGFLERLSDSSVATKGLALELLSSLNIASTAFVSTQYDHEVQANSVIKPLQGKGQVNGEISLIRPVLDSKKGLMLSSALCPEYSDINSYNMAARAIDTAVRNLVAHGANPDKIALLDNFCWCSANDPARLRQLKEAAKACYDYALAYEAPFISGKDSMFNDFKGFDENGEPVKISAPPTLLISSIAVLDDVFKSQSMDFKSAGDLIYVLGQSKFARSQLDRVDAQKNRKLYKSIFNAYEQDLISAAYPVNRGGIFVTLAKMSMAGGLGLQASLETLLEASPSLLEQRVSLFGESEGRIMVSVNPSKQEEFEKILAGNDFELLGVVEKSGYMNFKLGRDLGDVVSVSLEEAQDAYKSRFKEFTSDVSSKEVMNKELVSSF